MADFQRRKVYDAEHFTQRMLDTIAKANGKMTLHNSTIVVPLEIRFGSLAHVQQYYDAVMATDWFKAQWPHAGSVTVEKRRTNSAAHYQASRIFIHDTEYTGNQWAMRELVVLHELAHHVGRDQHGPNFVGAFIFLVENAMSPEAALLLRDAMYAHNVKINPL